MEIKKNLAYIGENFNIIFNTKVDLEKIADIVRNIVSEYDKDDVEIDEANNKVFINTGYVGNGDEYALEICKSVAAAYPDSEFYGHSYYPDENSGYESNADYQFEHHKLHIEENSSENGSPLCGHCGAQVGFFDDYDGRDAFHCQNCGKDTSALEAFGELPIKKILYMGF